MSCTDRRPLANAPATNQIMWRANNRLGAVYSALYSFWSARHTAVTAGQQILGARRDAYSIVLFNESATNILVNDFTSSPDQLLNTVLANQASGGTNFAEALRAGQTVMVQQWNTERFAKRSDTPRLVKVIALSLKQVAGYDIPFRWRMFGSRLFCPRCLSLRRSAWVSYHFLYLRLAHQFVGNRSLFTLYPLAEIARLLHCAGWLNLHSESRIADPTIVEPPRASHPLSLLLLIQ